MGYVLLWKIGDAKIGVLESERTHYFTAGRVREDVRKTLSTEVLRTGGKGQVWARHITRTRRTDQPTKGLHSLLLNPYVGLGKTTKERCRWQQPSQRFPVWCSRSWKRCFVQPACKNNKKNAPALLSANM